jgi:hypothetical protein
MYLQQLQQQEDATPQQGNWLADVVDAGTSTAASAAGSSRQLLASNSASGQRTAVSWHAVQQT